MKKRNILPLVFLLTIVINLSTNAQEDQKKEEKKPLTFKPLKFNITEDGSQWVRFILWNQVQLNSNNLSGDDNFNVKPNIRRSRLLVLSQVTDKIFTYIHMGVNNVNSGRLGQIDGSDPTQLFLHDAAIDYKFSEALSVGGGLHYWNGLARLSSWAGLTSLTYDIPNPLVFVPGIGGTDQFARHVGIYAKGKLGKFEYRVAVNDPSLTGFRETPTNVSENNSVYGAWNFHDKGRTILEGNLKYNFIGSESNLLPYVVGTYLGKKKTLSASVGFFNHANSTFSLINDANPILETDDAAAIASKTNTGNTNHFSFDVNYDTPLGSNGGALTAYGAYINYDYGENGGGPAGATGNALYAHLGYLIPKTKMQPYIAYQNRDWDDTTVLGSQRGGTTTNLGLNYYISGHNLKLTLEYVKSNFDVGADNSQLRFQAHIFL